MSTLSGSRRIGKMLGAFVLAPAGLVVIAVSARSFVVKRIAITLFCAAYAATMKLGPSSDGTQHFARLDWHYAGLDFHTFVQELMSILTFQYNPTGVQDVFMHVLSYVTSSLLNWPGLFFPLIGVFFGWFFGGALLIALQGFDVRKTNYVLLYFVILLLLIRGINQMQAVRMWTGMWLLIYGVLAYSQTRRPMHLLQIIAAPLIHISYFAIVPAVLLGLALRKRWHLIAIAFVVTSVFSVALAPNVMGGVEDSELGKHYVHGYAREGPRSSVIENAAIRSSTTSWHNALTRAGVPNYGFLILALTLILSGSYKHMSRPARDVMTVALMVFIFANFAVSLPELAGRSRLIAANLLVMAFLMNRFRERQSEIRQVPARGIYKVGVNASVILTLPLLLFSLSSLLDHLSLYLFLLPFIAVFVPEANMSLKEFLLSLA